MPVERRVFSFSFVARVFVIGFGGMAIAWGLFVFPVFWQQSSLETIARHIVAGDIFKGDVVDSMKTGFVELGRDKWSRPSVLSSAAVVDLRVLEQAIAKDDRKNLDTLMTTTDEMIRRSLTDTPADPFLWTVLFWLENTRSGFSKSHLQYLKMSYFLGPNEGWIGVKRNRFALALYPSLPKDLGEDAVHEFSRLVGSNYISEAADILGGPGWRVRDILLSGLKDVDEDSRQAFSKYIYKQGYDLAVPGVERPEWRPWH